MTVTVYCHRIVAHTPGMLIVGARVHEDPTGTFTDDEDVIVALRDAGDTAEAYAATHEGFSRHLPTLVTVPADTCAAVAWDL